MGEWQETRQERRDRRKIKKREQMAKHGASLARVYVDAILKRAQQKAKRRTSRRNDAGRS